MPTSLDEFLTARATRDVRIMSSLRRQINARSMYASWATALLSSLYSDRVRQSGMPDGIDGMLVLTAFDIPNPNPEMNNAINLEEIRKNLTARMFTSKQEMAEAAKFGICLAGEAIKDIAAQNPALLDIDPSLPVYALRKLRDIYSHPTTSHHHDAKLHDKQCRKEHEFLTEVEDYLKATPQTLLETKTDDPRVKQIQLGLKFYERMMHAVAIYDEMFVIGHEDITPSKMKFLIIMGASRALGITPGEFFLLYTQAALRNEIVTTTELLYNASLFHTHHAPVIYTDTAVQNLRACRNKLAHFQDVFDEQPDLETLKKDLMDGFKGLESLQKALVRSQIITSGDDLAPMIDKLAAAYGRQLMGGAIKSPEKRQAMERFVNLATRMWPQNLKLQDAAIISFGRRLPNISVERAETLVNFIETHRQKHLQVRDLLTIPDFNALSSASQNDLKALADTIYTEMNGTPKPATKFR